MNIKNKGFTLIELVVVVALVVILAMTFSIKIKPIIDNGKVSRVVHYLGMIRSKLNISVVTSNEYPDLGSNDDSLLRELDVYPTEDFRFDGEFHDETDKVVEIRDNTGGWYYEREEGEIYANLPDGAYTGDIENEIWSALPLGFTLDELREMGIVLDDEGNYVSNGDFEEFDEDILRRFENNRNWLGFDASKIGNWQTEDSARNVELWKSGFLGVEAVSGDYFMELNSNGENSIYQDIEVVPGTTIEWSVSHRGRSGDDTAAVRIGSGDNESITEMTTGKDAWVQYSGTYEVPEGQTTLRIYIDSVDNTGSSSVGNLLDNFNIGVKLD